MPSGPQERYDFFLSRRGSVATVAREVADILATTGYKLLVEDYDIPLTANFIEEMHEALKKCRSLIILYTHDYLTSPYTRKEFTTFEAERLRSPEERHIFVLRCEDVPIRGLLADCVYEDLVGIEDPSERRRRILGVTEARPASRSRPYARLDRIPDRFLFVCHASEDRDAALSIVRDLEQRKVPCWIAPRDVHPGLPFDDEIAEAIEGCKGMLLIFSDHCNDRDYVRREVTVAGESRKLIIPYRIERAQPKKALRLRLSDLHWIDAFLSQEEAIDQVVITFSKFD
jgi:hypothetical protein